MDMFFCLCPVSNRAVDKTDGQDTPLRGGDVLSGRWLSPLTLGGWPTEWNLNRLDGGSQ